jgi:hypothetical protein
VTGGVCGDTIWGVRSTELPVGESARARAGLAIMASLGLAAVFAVLTVVSKETPALDLRQPWQDDPYDVVVSLDFVVLPLLVTIGLLRVQLCRRYEPLPARRLVDLLRVGGAAVAVSLATELAEWVAVLMGRHRATWTAATTAQVVALAALTAATIGAWVLLRRAARTVTRVATAAAQPDWLTDCVALGLRAAAMLGRHRGRAQAVVGWADTRVLARVRAHPVAAAGLVAVALALPFVVAKIVLEGYPAPLVLLVFAFVTASLFAFLVIVGGYLRLVAPHTARTPVWLSSTVLACTAGSVAFAFHDSLLAQQSVRGLSTLFFGAALAAGTASIAAQTLWQRRNNRTPD